MNYKEIIETIKQLPWHRYRPEDIIYISIAIAYEFSESLNIALKAYPTNEHLKKMGEVKLATTNLAYENYDKKGNHDIFLAHFIGTAAFMKRVSEDVFWAREAYWLVVRKLRDSNKRISAIITYSRIQEFPSVLENILKAHDWEELGFGFYKYYLERIIILDVEIANHSTVKRSFEENDKVAMKKFYEALLELYQSLEK